MSAEKGYLKNAWNLVGAMMNNPRQAISDIGRGMSAEFDRPDGFVTMPNLLTYGGAGLALMGVLAPALWPATAAGLVATASGLGRYRSEGEHARFEERRVGMEAAAPAAHL